MLVRNKKYIRFLLSLLIFSYLGYVFLVSIPKVWRSKLPDPLSFMANHPVYPWSTWNMFFASTYGHYELRAYGVHADGTLATIDIDSISPKTNNWVTEGNRITWGAMSRMIADEPVRGQFCLWVGNQYNLSKEVRLLKVKNVRISIAMWPLPPDTRNAPQEERVIVECTL